jgi:hypothetical protein
VEEGLGASTSGGAGVRHGVASDGPARGARSARVHSRDCRGRAGVVPPAPSLVGATWRCAAGKEQAPAAKLHICCTAHLRYTLRQGAGAAERRAAAAASDRAASVLRRHRPAAIAAVRRRALLRSARRSYNS